MSTERELVLAIDAGSTFADIALVDVVTGETWLGKALRSTEQNDIFTDTVRQLVDATGAGMADITTVVHGTTVVTNSIIETSGAQAALVLTEGFRDVLEIGRHDVPRNESVYRWSKPERPVAAARIFEVDGRVGADGIALVAPTEESITRVADRIREAGATSVGICLLNSYLNAEHEQLVAQRLAELLPDVLVTTSSEIQPVMREFERTLLTALNAVQLPLMAAYCASFEAVVRDMGITTPVLYMQSNGGVLSGAQARRLPVVMALSGPAAGVQGAARIANRAGARNAITVDVGGTSSDIGLIVDGAPRHVVQGAVGPWNVSIPMVDVQAIGAGGGSIVRPGRLGGLEVGPQSAGAWPGPACYGHGGKAPTVTDAHAMLGRLPLRLANSALLIDPKLSARAFQAEVGEPLGISAEEAAQASLHVVNETMAGSVRKASIERGFDIRSFTLVPLGGGGPLHAAEVATILGLERVVVPATPGVLAARGLLDASLSTDLAVSFPPVDAEGADAITVLDHALARLRAQATEWFELNEVKLESRRIEFTADMRYANQGFELLVQADAGEGVAGPAQLRADFDALHEEQYTFALPGSPVDVIALRARVTAVLPSREDRRAVWGAAPAGVAESRRRVWFATSGWEDTAIFARASLDPGWQQTGPLIVEQPDTNILVPDGWRARLLEGDDLELQR